MTNNIYTKCLAVMEQELAKAERAGRLVIRGRSIEQWRADVAEYQRLAGLSAYDLATHLADSHDAITEAARVS